MSLRRVVFSVWPGCSGVVPSPGTGETKAWRSQMVSEAVLQSVATSYGKPHATQRGRGVGVGGAMSRTDCASLRGPAAERSILSRTVLYLPPQAGGPEELLRAAKIQLSNLCG
jgi:hypothetical protein